MRTVEELKSKIDSYFGMGSELVMKDNTSAKLVYKSPTGIILFNVNIQYSTMFGSDGWEFSGHDSLPESWSDLCKIHK